MRKSILALFVMLLTAEFCQATDDMTLSRLLVGEWQGGRHAVQYAKDGTWRFDPKEGTTHGTWRIVKGNLIEAWRFEGAVKDSSASYEILVLDQRTLKTRGKDGTVFTSTRAVAAAR